MNDLLIGSSVEDGAVSLKYSSGELVFEGRFMPENTKEYFEPIAQWVSNYISNPQPKTELIFKLDYFNTSFSKKLLDLMSSFEELKESGKDVSAQWFYKKNDDDLLEAGKGYAEMVDLDFAFKTID